MRPTLNDGDKWLVDYDVADLKRGDIVVLKYPKDVTKQYVKRIVGLPGESIEVRDGIVFINGMTVVEDYVDQSYNQSATSFPVVNIEANHYFVIGDNRDNSSDSRYWGTVERSLVPGKLYAKYSTGK